MAFGAARAIPPGVCWESPVETMRGCCLRLKEADDCNFPVCAVLLSFVNDQEGQVLHKIVHGGPLHGEVLCNCATCREYELTFAKHRSSISWVDVKPSVRVASLISFLISHQPSDTVDYMVRGFEPLQ